MSANTVATPSASDTETIDQRCATVCDLCEGIGKKDHPRSTTVSTRFSTSYEIRPYQYIYLHYPNPGLLRSSYERYGCQMCRLILACIQHELTGSVGQHVEQAQGDAERLASFDVAQDTYEAASLLRFAGIVEEDHLRIRGCGSGRVALGTRVESEWGPREINDGQNEPDMSIYVFNTSVAPPLPKRIQLFCSPVDPIDENHVHRPAMDLLSDAHAGLVHRWMSTCEAEHKTCRKHSETVQKLPTRLLKIEEQNGEVIAVRLVDTGDFEGTYACLSYCWGSKHQLSMTTTANRNEYRHAISWQELPSTISDAIKFCHRLKFEYLWVDSLCIVQDDDEDWLREASNMASIYSRSALTLAIHLCDDASQSFLQKRLLDTEKWSDGPYGSTRIPLTDRNAGNWGDMYLWGDESFKGSRFLDRMWYSIRGAERDENSRGWLSRAWTFQEWFLSPRVLHIHAMTVWDCFERQGNELEKRFLCRPSIERHDPGILRDWPSMVHDFSSRQITEEKDRLPALAGLAQRFHARGGDVYLAGLWLETLPRSLFWIRSSSLTSLKSPVDYRAPTWSWAALEGGVAYDHFYYSEMSPTSIIVGHYCQYSPPGTFATVKDAWLDIEGPVSVVSGWAMHDGNSWLSDIRLFTPDQLEDTQSQQYWIATLDQGHSLQEKIRCCEVYLLDSLQEEEVNLDEESLRRYALVLQIVRRPGTGQDCFKRLGIAYFEYPIPSDFTAESWTTETIRLI